MPWYTDQKCEKDIENLSKIYGQRLKRIVLTAVLRLVEIERAKSLYGGEKTTEVFRSWGYWLDLCLILGPAIY